MKRALVLSAAVAVVVAIVLFATCDGRRDAPGDVAPSTSTASPPVAKPRTPRVRSEEPAPSVEPTTADATSAPAATAPVTAQMTFNPIGAKVAAPRKVVRGRVVDAKGRPVVGVDVEVCSLWLPADVARSERRYAYAHVATAADGTFALPYFEGGPRGLIVKRGGSTSLWRWSSQYFGDEEVYEIVLPSALPSVTVRVTRASDGAVLAAAEVWLTQQGVGWPGWRDSPSRVEWGDSRPAPGTFRYEDVAAGPMTLYVAATGLAPSERQIQVPATGEMTIDVALKPGVAVRGTVVDAVTNNAVAGARVRWESRDSPGTAETVCDGDGKFVIDHLPFEANAAQPMTAGADGYADTMFWPGGTDDATERIFTVQLTRPATVVVRCVDDARRPLSGVIVAAFSDYETTPVGGARIAAHSSASATTEPDGLATLAKLHPGTALRVFCYVDGVRVFGRTYPALVAGETRDLGDVVLAPPK
jgi:hypothetical protein